MDVQFRNTKFEKAFSSRKALVQKYGEGMAKKIMIRMGVLQAASSLANISILPPERCHELSGKRKGEFAVDLEHPWRLIFRPTHDPVPLKEDGGIDIHRVTTITILSVEDYHG